MTPAQIIANLTAKERAVMKALYFNVYGERGCGVYSHLSDESMEPSGLPAASLPGVIASLCTKGLYTSRADDGGKPGERILWQTDEGRAVMAELAKAEGWK